MVTVIVAIVTILVILLVALRPTLVPPITDVANHFAGQPPKDCADYFMSVVAGQLGTLEDDAKAADCVAFMPVTTEQTTASRNKTHENMHSVTRLGETVGDRGKVIAFIIHDGYPESFWIVYLDESGKVIMTQ